MAIIRSIGLFALAAVAEIGGAWLVWQGVREHRCLLWIGAGVAAPGLYGFVRGVGVRRAQRGSRVRVHGQVRPPGVPGA